MKKFTLFTVILLLFTSLIYADYSETELKIEGYKLSNMPKTGILRVYVFNTSSSKDSDTSVNNQINLSDYIANYISGYKDVFSIKVQTNLARTITIKITANPFVYWETSTTENGVTTKTAKSVLKTSYKLTSSSGTYTTSKTYSDYYYKYTSNVSTSSQATTLGKNNSTVSASTIATLTLSAQHSSDNNDWSYWSSVSSIPVNNNTDKVLKNIEENATIDSMIYVTMKLGTTSNNILPNVQYVAPITITVSST